MNDDKKESIQNVPSSTLEALAPLVYQELRSIARRERRILSGGETLVTTALINEAYVRLASQPIFATRGDFMRIAAVTIRHVLVDQVRSQLSLKRGGGKANLELEEAAEFEVDNPKAVVQIQDALEALGQHHPRLVSIVECRFFAGYSESETAEALGVSERTVQRDWALARAWLKRELMV